VTADEQAIRDVVETWMAAAKAGNLTTLLSLMTDDVVFLVPGQEPFGRDAFAAASKQTADAEIDGTSEIVELRVLNDWAFIRSRLRVTVTPRSAPPIVRSGYTLTLLRKEADGRWRLARDANLLTAET
jgi:uncharacterized protein (TIGR02246 family)